jgi:hypothetical protein
MANQAHTTKSTCDITLREVRGESTQGDNGCQTTPRLTSRRMSLTDGALMAH